MQYNAICRHCGREYPADAVPVVDACEHPELTQKVLDLSLFLSDCPACGAQSAQEYPCVWLHPRQGLLVELIPRGTEPFLPGQIAHACTTLRYVHCLHAFREKVLIFTKGLDDRAVEMLKAFTAAQNSDMVDPADPASLTLTDADSETLRFLAFPPHGSRFSLKTPVSFYKKIQADMSSPVFETYGFHLVDRQWILDRVRF